MLVEIVIVLTLTIINGALAMSELAVVNARPARLKVLSDQGSTGARAALALAEDPGRFLSTVQIGITLVGIVAGAFSGATLGVRLSAWLASVGLPSGIAGTLGIGLVVVAITYLSLIIGELVPKRIALRNPERIAARTAPAMALLARVAKPLVWLLDASGKLVLRLLGQSGKAPDGVTEEEVKLIIAEATNVGVLEREEREMIAGVMRLADRQAKALMTPRGDVEFLDIDAGREQVLERVRATRRSRLPVKEGGADDIVGVVHVRDVLDEMADGSRPFDLRRLVQNAPVVADTARALDVLKTIRGSTVHMALVFDEYGHFEGVVTSADVLEAITGAFQEEEYEEPDFVRRADGSFLVSGAMPVDEFSEKIGVPVDLDGDFATVAGFVLESLSRLPETGESFQTDGWRIEVVDLDGRRIDKVLVERIG